MARRYEIVYPAKGRQLFDGGLNNKFERSIIAPNESPDCYNVVFSNGAVETRGGSSQLNTAPIGSFAVDGLYTRRSDTGAETMVAFAGGSAWYLSGTSFNTIPSAQSVFTAGQRVAATQYQNQLFIGNGGITPYKYDGTNFTRHGVPAATGTVSAVSSDSGVISAGTYMYWVTYVNSHAAEGDVGTAATVTLSATATVSLSDIPVAPQSHGVNARRIYRTDGTSSTVGFRVAEIADNTTTTYDDTTANEDLGAEKPTDKGEPPKYSVLAYHQNRLFMNDTANPNFLWYSDLEEPFTVQSTNFLKIGDQASDLIKTVDVYQNHIVVGCERSPCLIYMPSTDDTTWKQIRIGVAYGSKSPFGGFAFRDLFMLPAFQNDKFIGFAALDGTTVDPSATALSIRTAGSEMQSDRIEPDIFLINEGQSANITSFVFRNKAFISVSYGASQNTNNRIFVFDFSLGNLSRKQRYSWTRYSGINAAQFAVYDGDLYIGSSDDDGLVHEIETNVYNDNGDAIDSYFWTKEIAGLPGHENYIKDFRRVKLLVDLPGNYNMNLSFRVDSEQSSSYNIPVSLNPGGSLWGIMQWSENWGGSKDQDEIELPLGQIYGKRIQFKFSNQNTVNQQFKVHGLNLTYNIRGV